ncbi:L-dopachrome tautomerase-related protein [Micromonospora sp. NPDC049799]|uniref:L-dopachrome tautomerase-related protein n=1 Tax=Micromonospora sp. NPDC049799 TaxID=3154741 RepID=UPI0033CE1F1A
MGDEPVGELEVVHTFTGPMPTGVSVSHTGRIFVNFPKWGDQVPATVVELGDGAEVPFPDQAWNSPSADDDAQAFVSVQSIVVDPADRLWVLDTGSPMFQPRRRPAARCRPARAGVRPPPRPARSARCRPRPGPGSGR